MPFSFFSPAQYSHPHQVQDPLCTISAQASTPGKDTKPIGEGKQTKMELSNTTARAVTASSPSTTTTAVFDLPAASAPCAPAKGNSSSSSSSSSTALHGSNLEGVVPCFEQVRVLIPCTCNRGVSFCFLAQQQP